MNWLQDLLGPEGQLTKLLSAGAARRFLLGLAIGVGVLVAFRMVRFLLGRFLRHRVSSRALLWSGKTVSYLGLLVAVLVVLDVAGLDLTAILGAAGIAGIALGFAAQTSIANIISGLFLVSEKSFSAGDVIKSGEVVGVVTSIDLLSVKLRTFENQQIRLPNESLIKNTLTNLTRFPVIRLNVRLTVGRDQDLEALRDLLKEAAAGIREVLLEPEPFFMVDSFEEDGIKVLLGLWVRIEDQVKVRNSIYVAIQRAFTREGLSSPFKRVEISEGPAPGGSKAKPQAEAKGRRQGSR